MTPNSCLSAGTLHHVEPALLADSPALSLAPCGCLPSLRPPANSPPHWFSLSPPPLSLRNPTCFSGSTSPMKASKMTSHLPKTHKNSCHTHTAYTHIPHIPSPHTPPTIHTYTSPLPHTTYLTHNRHQTHTRITYTTTTYACIHHTTHARAHLQRHHHQLPPVCSCTVLVKAALLVTTLEFMLWLFISPPTFTLFGP